MKTLEFKSKYQTIRLEHGPDRVRLFLDDFTQFDSHNEAIYHQLIAIVPAVFAEKNRTALILGGGDGLAARELLRQGFGKIVNVELDKAVADLAKKNPIAKLNRMAFSNPRVRLIIGDALKWVPKLPAGGFDVVMADFPANTSRELSKLYARSFHKQISRLVSPGGVFVTQISEGPTIAEFHRDRLEEIYGHALSIRATAVGFEEMFVYASRLPFAARHSAGGAQYAEQAVGLLLSARSAGKDTALLRA